MRKEASEAKHEDAAGLSGNKKPITNCSLVIKEKKRHSKLPFQRASDEVSLVGRRDKRRAVGEEDGEKPR